MPGVDAAPREHLELLYHAGLEFNSTLDLEQLLPRVFDRALEVLQAEAGSIWLRTGDHLVCRIARGPVSEEIEGLELPLGAGIVGDVARTGEGELVEDARRDPRFVHQVDEATGFVTRSMLVAPLKVKDEVLGVLQVLNRRSGSGQFDESDLALLVHFGATAALALRNAQLFDAEKRARDLRTLLAVSREVTSTLDLDRLLVTVVNLASQTLPYDRAAIVLEEGGRSVLRAVSGQETVDRRSETSRELERLIGWLVERDEVAYVSDVRGDGDLAAKLREAFPAYFDRAGVRSLLLAPLRDEEGRLGAFYLESASAGFLGDGGRDAAELLANHVSVAIRNAELHGQVPLIGLLEPVAAWRRRWAAMPRDQRLKRVGLPAAVLIGLLLIPWGERIAPRETRLVPGDRTPVRATVGGLLADVRVEEGDAVERGQILAVLQDDALRMRRQETEAGLAIAERRAAAAQARGDGTEAQIATLEVRERSAQRALLDDQLERMVLRASAEGVVLTPRVDDRLGEWLTPGETFVTLGRTDHLEIESYVAQRDIERVRIDRPIRLKVPAQPDYTFVGRVTEIAPQADTAAWNEATFVVRGRLENGHGLLRPGMEAKAKIVGSSLPIGYQLVRPLVRWLQLRVWR